MNPPASRVISADSHVTEPPDLWLSRIDRAFRDRAPHYVHDADRGGLLFLIDGQIPKPVNVNIAVGQRPEDYREFFAKGLEAARPGGWDPVERLKDMDVDGIECAVLYTSQGFRLFALDDPPYQEACFRAYNDWLAEHCQDARRLHLAGLERRHRRDHGGSG